MIEPMKSATKEIILKRVQERVATVSIGASTLRNQGAKGVIKTARDFLANKVDLADLEGVTAIQFNKWLDNKTNALKNKFPGEAKGNWGAARKAINIFLEECFLNRLLAEEYNLTPMAEFLEVPLDSNVANTIIEESEKKGLTWTSIKCLTPKQSGLFQECATILATNKGTQRGYLDLWYWQKRDDTTKHQRSYQHKPNLSPPSTSS